VPDRRRRAVGFSAALLTGAVVLAGCGSSEGDLVPRTSQIDNRGFQGTYLPPGYDVVDQPLEDTAGKATEVASDPSPVKVVFYGYTNCPDICQIMMSTIASALTRLDPAQRAQVATYFITTDPARDTGKALRTYLDRFNPDFIGLTGPLPDIEKLAEPMKVFLAKGRKLPSGGYEVDHTTYVYGITGKAARVLWNQGTSPAAMAADIIKLLTSPQKESS